LARPGSWAPGLAEAAGADDERDVGRRASDVVSDKIARAVDRAVGGAQLDESEIVALFSARGRDFAHVCETADRLRASVVGDAVGYVVTRNINYTNICLHRCGFCAFSKGKAHEALRGQPYLVELPEIRRRVSEAWARGATEVCMQGGIHPSFTGETYLAICRAAKEAIPQIHVHAFSPLEVTHGARSCRS
jgi:FO synthase